MRIEGSGDEACSHGPKYLPEAVSRAHILVAADPARP
jgi:hypothetical protein